MTRISNTMLVVSTVVVAAALVPSVSAAWKVGSGGRVMYDDNCDFFGGDLFLTSPVSVTRCGDMCADMPQCTHWTWVNNINDGGGGCWWKTGRTAKVSSAPGFGCGYVIGRFNS